MSYLSLLWRKPMQLIMMLNVPYILAYKPTIFSWNLTIKLWGSAYTRVIAQQPELARHGPLVGACRVRGRRQDLTQTAAAVSAYQCGGLHCGGWTHRRMSACVRGASACVGVRRRNQGLRRPHGVTMHRSTVLVRRGLSLLAYMQVTSFC